MFYCDDCGEKNGWPQGLHCSRGKCEVCEKVKECNSVPSSKLRPLREAKPA